MPTSARTPRTRLTALHQPASAWLAVGGACVLLSALGACTITSDSVGSKVDYRAATIRPQPLDVPPDLTQLASDPRYQPNAGAPVSAAAIQAASPGRPLGTTSVSTAGAVVAPIASGGVRIERAGTLRWLVVDQAPEQLWPQLRSFWPANGFNIQTDRPELGVMETDWAENKAKLPQTGLQGALGGMLAGLMDSGQRDRFRLRVERSTTSNASEIFLSHRASIQVVSDAQRDTTRWQFAPADPQVEAEMLGRLMLHLSNGAVLSATPAKPAASAITASVDKVNAAPDGPARARLLDGRPAATLQVDDDFARAWRRVGVALDRQGFTVEDRDRGQGIYYVRYVDPKLAGKEDPGFFARLFSGDKKEELGGSRYRVRVQAEGKVCLVGVYDAQGTPQNTESARNIVQLLLADLR